jgi:hypothetical protein
MGGSNKSTNTENSITASQQATQNQENTLASQNQAEGLALMQPLIAQLTSLSSGNPASVQSALAPYLTNITQSNSQQKGSIMESMGPGVGRDVALSQVKQNSGNQIAAEKNSLIQGAGTQLAQVGAGVEGFGLSQVGAGISAGTAAATSNQSVMQQQQAQKASTLSFIGELAGAGGGALGRVFAPPSCWIAEAIYGVDDLRTHIIRAWLTGPFERTLLGGAAMWLYRKFGRAVAYAVERSAFLRWLLKPIFDIALSRALSSQVSVDSVLYARS